MRDLLTAVRQSIRGMWTTDTEFKSFITEIHGFLDRMVKFCNRRAAHNKAVDNSRNRMEPPEPHVGEVFFPQFCAAASSPGHDHINRALRNKKFFEPLFIDDKFVMPKRSKPETMETKLWQLRRRFAVPFPITFTFCII